MRRVHPSRRGGRKHRNLDLHQMTISPCIGCIKGGKDPKSPCIQKDDMDEIYPAYQEADILVLASPMYYWRVTAILKAAFDRLFAVAEANNYINPHKDCIMLMAAEGNTDDNWRPVIDYYKSLLSTSSRWMLIRLTTRLAPSIVAI